MYLMKSGRTYMYADLDMLQCFIDMSLEYCEKYFK